MTSKYLMDTQERSLSHKNAMEGLNLSGLKAKFVGWMKQNSNNLYPSRQDKLQIAKELGTTLDQINRLLANHRRRQLKNQSKKLHFGQQQPLLATPTFINDKENQQQLQQSFSFINGQKEDRLLPRNGQEEQQRDKRIEQTIDDIICKESFGTKDNNNPLHSYNSTASRQKRESTPTHQVVPDLTRNMMMTSPENSYFQQQQYNMLHQGGEQYNNNLAALMGTLAQHQQQQQLLAPQAVLNYYPVHTASLPSQLPDNTNALPALLAKQNEVAVTTANQNDYAAANLSSLVSQQAMQIAIQKELQILYQRHYLQQIMQQQQQVVQKNNNNANNASLLLSSLPTASHEQQAMGYATSCSPAQHPSDQQSHGSSSSSSWSSSSTLLESTAYSHQPTNGGLSSRLLTEKESLAVMVLAAGFSPDTTP